VRFQWRAIPHLSQRKFCGGNGVLHVLLSAARVAKALAEYRLDIEIHHDQIFFELTPASDNFAKLIQHQTAAVKHQLILTTDEIRVRNDYRIVACSRLQHPFAPLALSRVIWGGRDIDQNLRAA
jgi:hypothetical protein